MHIVITGASKGLGRAIALAFARKGQHHFYCCARNLNALEALKADLVAINPAHVVHVFAVDMANEIAVKHFAHACLAIATPDIIVNNAGQFIPGNVHNEAEGALRQMLDVNLMSAYYLTRKLLPAMMQQQSGHIFNICSIASLAAYTGGGAYSISKFALAGFSQNLRAELKEYGIKVTAVYPGAAYTDSWIGSGVSEERIMEANDIAAMVTAAASLSPQACVESILLQPQLGPL